MTGPVKLITSLQNDEVKTLVKLRKRRERERRQLAILEEALVVSRAVTAGYPLDTVYFCPECLEEYDHPVLAALHAIENSTAPRFIEVTKPVMAKIGYRDNPEGLLVTAPQIHTSLAELPTILTTDQPALLVVLESVEKPGNLGAVLRIADGAGVQAVIVCGDGVDLFNPNVLRASRGACFCVPTLSAETGEVLQALTHHQIATVATTPAASDSWHDTDFSGPTAIVLGTEHDGLSDRWLDAADLQVSLPMAGAGDSLNVSTTAAILLYEAVRQRQSGSIKP